MAVPDSEYIPPTDEQLINFATIVAAGPGYSNMQRDIVKMIFETNPESREKWLGIHKKFQDEADQLGKELRSAKEDDHLHGL